MPQRSKRRRETASGSLSPSSSPRVSGTTRGRRGTTLAAFDNALARRQSLRSAHDQGESASETAPNSGDDLVGSPSKRRNCGDVSFSAGNTTFRLSSESATLLANTTEFTSFLGIHDTDSRGARYKKAELATVLQSKLQKDEQYHAKVLVTLLEIMCKKQDWMQPQPQPQQPRESLVDSHQHEEDDEGPENILGEFDIRDLRRSIHFAAYTTHRADYRVISSDSTTLKKIVTALFEILPDSVKERFKSKNVFLNVLRGLYASSNFRKFYGYKPRGNSGMHMNVYNWHAICQWEFSVYNTNDFLHYLYLFMPGQGPGLKDMTGQDVIDCAYGKFSEVQEEKGEFHVTMMPSGVEKICQSTLGINFIVNAEALPDDEWQVSVDDGEIVLPRETYTAIVIGVVLKSGLEVGEDVYAVAADGALATDIHAQVFQYIRRVGLEDFLIICHSGMADESSDDEDDFAILDGNDGLVAPLPLGQFGRPVRQQGMQLALRQAMPLPPFGPQEIPWNAPVTRVVAAEFLRLAEVPFRNALSRVALGLAPPVAGPVGVAGFDIPHAAHAFMDAPTAIAPAPVQFVARLAAHALMDAPTAIVPAPVQVVARLAAHALMDAPTAIVPAPVQFVARLAAHALMDAPTAIVPAPVQVVARRAMEAAIVPNQAAIVQDEGRGATAGSNSLQYDTEFPRLLDPSNERSSTAEDASAKFWKRAQSARLPANKEDQKDQKDQKQRLSIGHARAIRLIQAPLSASASEVAEWSTPAQVPAGQPPTVPRNKNDDGDEQEEEMVATEASGSRSRGPSGRQKCGRGPTVEQVLEFQRKQIEQESDEEESGDEQMASAATNRRSRRARRKRDNARKQFEANLAIAANLAKEANHAKAKLLFARFMGLLLLLCVVFHRVTPKPTPTPGPKHPVEIWPFIAIRQCSQPGPLSNITRGMDCFEIRYLKGGKLCCPSSNIGSKFLDVVMESKLFDLDKDVSLGQSPTRKEELRIIQDCTGSIDMSIEVPFYLGRFNIYGNSSCPSHSLPNDKSPSVGPSMNGTALAVLNQDHSLELVSHPTKALANIIVPIEYPVWKGVQHALLRAAVKDLTDRTCVFLVVYDWSPSTNLLWNNHWNSKWQDCFGPTTHNPGPTSTSHNLPVLIYLPFLISFLSVLFWLHYHQPIQHQIILAPRIARFLAVEALEEFRRRRHARLLAELRQEHDVRVEWREYHRLVAIQLVALIPHEANWRQRRQRLGAMERNAHMAEDIGDINRQIHRNAHLRRA